MRSPQPRQFKVILNNSQLFAFPIPMTTTTSEKVRWTTADLELFPDNGNRYEIIDGELFVTRAPHWKQCDEKIENWRNVAEWLEEAGYKTPSAAKLPVSNFLLENSVVNITNINIEPHQLVIVINLRIPTSVSSEPSIQNLDLGDDTIK